MYFDQREYDIRFEWGLSGLEALAPTSDVVIIVDVLSFCTCVDIVVANDAVLYPYRGKREDLAEFAAGVDALYARAGRGHGVGYGLAPSSLTAIPSGTRLVLPSPNGSTLSLATGQVPTMAGCLRNAEAVAAGACRIGSRIGVVAAGERWRDGLLRPALEDLLGAGAIIQHLPGRHSPEACLAVAGFMEAQPVLTDRLAHCGSGKELIGRGLAGDVHLAGQMDISSAAPLLADGAYRNMETIDGLRL